MMIIPAASCGSSSENEDSGSVKSKSSYSKSSVQSHPTSEMEYGGNQNVASNESSALSYYSYYDEQVSMHNKPRVIQGDPDQTLQE